MIHSRLADLTLPLNLVSNIAMNAESAAPEAVTNHSYLLLLPASSRLLEAAARSTRAVPINTRKILQS